MSESAKVHVGMIGVGLLGTAIAERLMAGGFSVTAFDTNDRQRGLLDAMGGQAVDSAADVAKQCRRILFSLPDSDVVQAVVAQLGDSLVAGTTIIDTTTGDPEVMGRLATQLAARHVVYLDATVAGSSQQMRDGHALILAGGSTAGYQMCGDMLDAISSRRIHLGPAGSGARMKLVVNLAIGLHRAVLAEAMAFGESCGFAAQEVLQVLRDSPGYSRAMDIKGEKMVQRDFIPQARLRQHLKDVRLILSAGRAVEARLPLSSLHAEILQTLVDRGFAEEDNSAILRAFLPDESTT